MARIELRDCTVRLKDGLSGSAAVNEPTTPPAPNDTEFDIDSIVLNTVDPDLVPIGARFTVAGETDTPIHVVTARTPTDTSPTTNIVFTPALASALADEAVITFLPQQLEIKIGDGNLTYTEHKSYDYLLDRGDLDTVREGDEVPMDVRIECVYEHITTGTNENISLLDALKQKGKATEWVSAAADQCEPYSVDVEVEHNVPCGTNQDETTQFPDFRHETAEINLKDATISITGKSNATEPIVNRI